MPYGIIILANIGLIARDYTLVSALSTCFSWIGKSNISKYSHGVVTIGSVTQLSCDLCKASVNAKHCSNKCTTV